MRILALLFLLFFLAGGAAQAGSPKAPRWNVLLVTVDCLRPDHLSLHGYERLTTPSLDAFAKEAWVFDNAFATSAWTSPGVVSMLTGYYPPVHGQNGRHSFYDERLSSGLRVLEQAGYRTIGRLNTGANYRGLGFQEEVGGQDIGDFVRNRASDIENAGDNPARPFFGWLHTKESHLPYAPTEANAGRWLGETIPRSPAVSAVTKHHVILRDPSVPVKFSHAGKVEFTEADVSAVRALYDETVRDADDHLARGFEALRETGLIDSTIVIISADHGEELLEHGWVGHASTGYDGKLTDELVRIPLVIRFPDKRAGRSQALVQGVDLMPSLFEWLGLSQDDMSPPMQGVSLGPLSEGSIPSVREFAFMQTTRKGWTTPKREMRRRATAVRSLDRKLIWIPAEAGRPARREAYDLSADPMEQRNLIQEVGSIPKDSKPSRVPAEIGTRPIATPRLGCSSPWALRTGRIKKRRWRRATWSRRPMLGAGCAS